MNTSRGVLFLSHHCVRPFRAASHVILSASAIIDQRTRPLNTRRHRETTESERERVRERESRKMRWHPLLHSLPRTITRRPTAPGVLLSAHVELKTRARGRGSGDRSVISSTREKSDLTNGFCFRPARRGVPIARNLTDRHRQVCFSSGPFVRRVPGGARTARVSLTVRVNPRDPPRERCHRSTAVDGRDKLAS